MVFSKVTDKAARDLWVVDTKSGENRDILATDFDERLPVVAANGSSSTSPIQTPSSRRTKWSSTGLAGCDDRHYQQNPVHEWRARLRPNLSAIRL